MSRYLPLIITGVLLNAFAQLALKQGMHKIGYFEFKLENFTNIFWTVSTSKYILAGISCYIISVVVWLLVLSRVDISYAYPLLSIGYIITAFAGMIFFQESISMTRWTGIIVICFGVWLITKSA
jgi:multidrug transporter EmrE-like cation transporter